MDIIWISLDARQGCFGLDVWLTKFEATRNGAFKCAHRSTSKRHGLATLRLVMWELLAIACMTHLSTH